MGPTIILDKSAYQCLSKDDTQELSRYFYVVIPPVLILEILADLKHPQSTPEEARIAVSKLARKLQPIDGKVNVDYRSLCISNLLGGKVAMDRRPIVGEGQRVNLPGGKHGYFMGPQPEKMALDRWSCERFDEAEEVLAVQWRASSQAFDLEAFQRKLRRVGWVPLKSLALVRRLVDEVIVAPEAQTSIMEWLFQGCLQGLRAATEVKEWTLSRWRNGDFSHIGQFAKYAQHCARVSMIFQMALIQELIGTRNTNRIDMDYFHYAPFAHIFCSGDKLHGDLAEHILDSDQSFVRSVDLKAALGDMVGLRISARAAGDRAPHLLEPPEGSLIRTLWVKHLGKGPRYAKQSSAARTEEEKKKLKKKLDSIVNACYKAKKNSPPPPRWPCA